uniref:Uncharacterized protein n=1 Tax=Knipowitschia caucasica TaxID=637954 RepID=A0AAV2IWW2_KNICA
MLTTKILTYEPVDATPTLGALVVALLSYLTGTAVMVMLVLHGLVDSIGGLMYVQNQQHFLEFHQEKQRRNDDV